MDGNRVWKEYASGPYSNRIYQDRASFRSQEKFSKKWLDFLERKGIKDESGDKCLPRLTDGQIAIAAFGGELPQGSSMEISGITRKGISLEVLVKINSPETNNDVGAEPISPYLIVTARGKGVKAVYVNFIN